MGPRPADPDPVLPLDGHLQPERRRRLPIFIGPTGWPNFLPTAHQRGDERHPPRRLRLLDHTGEKVNDRSSERRCPTFILATTALVIWIGWRS